MATAGSAICTRLARPLVAHHAADPSGRGADVRRLCRADGGGDRRRHGRGPAGADLRGGAGRVQLHLRRGALDAVAAGLDRLPCRRVRQHGRGGAADRLRQPQGRRHRGQPLRARHQPDLPGHGHPLRHGDPAGPGAQAARQGQGRGCRPGRATLGAGPAAPSPVLLLGGAERRDPRVDHRPEQPAHAPPRHQPPRAVRGDRAPGPAGDAGRRRMPTRNGAAAGPGWITTSRCTGISTRCRIA